LTASYSYGNPFKVFEVENAKVTDMKGQQCTCGGLLATWHKGRSPRYTQPWVYGCP
jgi:hypothetical protein